MIDDQIDYDKVNRLVEKRLKARKEFQEVVLSFVIVTAVVWTIYLLTGGTGFLWPLIPMVVMAIIVGWQALETYVLSEARDRERERLIEHEIDRERARLYGDAALEKPKRDQAARLSDDGELVYEDEALAEPRRSAKRRR